MSVKYYFVETIFFPEKPFSKINWNIKWLSSKLFPYIIFSKCTSLVTLILLPPCCAFPKLLITVTLNFKVSCIPRPGVWTDTSFKLGVHMLGLSAGETVPSPCLDSTGTAEKVSEWPLMGWSCTAGEATSWLVASLKSLCLASEQSP